MKNLLIFLSFLFTACGTTSHVDNTIKDTIINQSHGKIISLYGLNGLTKFNSASVDDENFQKTLDSIGIDYFRYPGGTNANYANWRTDSPSLKSLQMMVRAVHCDIVFDINILTSTLSEQMAMLDSANKLGLITDKTIIELGNELNQFNYEGKDRFPTAVAYGNVSKYWISVISKKYPKVSFACVGENKSWKGAENWAKDVLSINSNVHLIWHFYPSGKFTHKGIADTNTLRKLIHTDYINSFGNIPTNKVWITEFNIADHDKDSAQGTLDTLNGDQIGSTLKFCLKEFSNIGIGVILKHNVVSGNPDNYPALEANKKISYLMPAGKAMREYLQQIKN